MESPTKQSASVHSHSKDRRAILIIILIVAVLVLVSLLFGKKTTQAATTPDGAMHGYAWSANTGWLSFNCMEGSATGGSVCGTSPYKVTATRATLPGGHAGVVFSGDAWSPSIGWVSFKPAESNVVALCGPAATMDLTTNTVSGWVRALNGTAAGGWDGCVQMTGATFNPSTLTLNGYAWGSINIGWLQFVGTIELLPAGSATVDLKITPSSGAATDGPVSLAVGSPATLSWTSTGTASCTTTGTTTTDWNSTSLPTAGSNAIHIIGPMTYTIQCTPSDGSASVTDSVTVTTSGVSTPAVSLNATPISVTAGVPTPVTLTWSTQYMAGTSACVGTSSPSVPGWNTPHSSSTGVAPSTLPSVTYTLNLTSTPETFTLSCAPAGGGTALTSSVTINVNYPACIVTTPGSGSIAPTGGTMPYQVTWANVASYPLTTVILGAVTPGASGVTASIAGTSTVSSPSGNITVSASGLTSSTSPQTVTVYASGTAGGSTVTCTPATLSLGNPSTTTGTGGTTPKTHLPWYDF